MFQALHCEIIGLRLLPAVADFLRINLVDRNRNGRVRDMFPVFEGDPRDVAGG
jgi:hypothetical protein